MTAAPMRLETIAIKMLNGDWRIHPVNFSLDHNNNFMSIYPTYLEICDVLVRMVKPLRHGNMMYREVSEDDE